MLLSHGSDIITPHITDSHAFDYPCFSTGFVCEAHLPRWAPIHIGGLELDLSPTKHVIWMGIAAILCLIVMLMAARAHRKTAETGKAPRGFSNGIEALILYIRNEVIIPNVGA